MSAEAPVSPPPAAPADTADEQQPQQQQQQFDGDEGLTLRALVSSKEAGVIIGRGGATIATIRSESNVKAGVSKVVPGVNDRILSVGGSVDGVAKAYSLVAQTVLENPSSTLPAGEEAPVPSSSTSIRLLISHLLIGSVIGKGGAKIRQIQDLSGARMVASKEMLPQSTERIVEVSGSAEAVRLAIAEISKCLIEDWDRSQGTVLYHPGSENGIVGNGYPSAQGSYGARRTSGGPNAAGGFRRSSAGFDATRERQPSGDGQARGPGGEPVSSSDPNYREQKISIPSDMVGCIIGRGGTKINEIRRLSGSKISIAKTAHDETGERMFVISGLPANNEKALFLLYNQLESEKDRRVQSVAEEDQAQETA
ncbi:hypothetical protein MNV49_007735 [Pseudohyphozyma bogoriensis]|nr:hypothetical protein MNV49_007735 [Pseudohyphozyma bogoriensis]